MKRKRILFIIVFMVFSAIAGYGETDVQKGTRIARMYFDMPAFGSVRATIVLKIYDNQGKLRFRKKSAMAQRTENSGTPYKVDKMIGYFMEPADDMGNSLLYLSYPDRPVEKYFYLKSIRKIKKLIGPDKKLSFFGSYFTNSEAGMPEFRDFTYRYLKDAIVIFKGKELECYMVECLPISEQVKNDLGYGKKIMYFEKKTLLGLKSEYFDENMNKTKETTVLSFIMKNNARGERVFYATGAEQRNLKTGTKSQLLFTDFLFEEDAGIKDDIFTIEYLTRKWW